MTSAITLFRRSLPLFTLCAALVPLAACKKKEDATAADATAGAPTPAAPTEPAPKDEAPAEFKAKWPSGRRAVVRIERIIELEPAATTAQPPAKLEFALATEMVFRTLKELEGGNSEVDAEFTHVKITSRAGGKATGEFDTRTSDPKADSKNQASALRKLVGSRVKYVFAADGKTEKVEGVGPVFQKIAAAAFSPLSRPVVPNFATEDAFKTFGTLTSGLPGNPVKPGDAWGTTNELPYGPFTLVLTGTNTFKGWETKNNRRLAKIETAGTVAILKPGAASTVTIADGATATGQFSFDPALGCSPEGQLNWSFTVNIPQPTGSTVTKVQVKQTSKVTEIIDPPVSAAKPAEPSPNATK